MAAAFGSWSLLQKPDSRRVVVCAVFGLAPGWGLEIWRACWFLRLSTGRVYVRGCVSFGGVGPSLLRTTPMGEHCL